MSFRVKTLQGSLSTNTNNPVIFHTKTSSVTWKGKQVEIKFNVNLFSLSVLHDRSGREKTRDQKRQTRRKGRKNAILQRRINGDSQHKLCTVNGGASQTRSIFLENQTPGRPGHYSLLKFQISKWGEGYAKCHTKLMIWGFGCRRHTNVRNCFNKFIP